MRAEDALAAALRFAEERIREERRSEMGICDAFVALDFETANEAPGSACALGVAEVRNGVLEASHKFILISDTSDFRFSAIHGITAEDSAKGMAFTEMWRIVEPQILAASDRVVAHNAAFDRRVLEICARRAHIRLPRFQYICTRNLAEAVWGLRPADLETVCRRLAIPLRHHDPQSDAEAAARIVLAAEDEKLRLRSAETQS